LEEVHVLSDELEARQVYPTYFVDPCFGSGFNFVPYVDPDLQEFPKAPQKQRKVLKFYVLEELHVLFDGPKASPEA
jgi:hypothetical protein